VMAEQALHPAVNLCAPATGEPHTLRGRKECLDLNQTQLLCSKHADHPSSACPLRLLQAHLALESPPAQAHLALDKSLMCRAVLYCKGASDQGSNAHQERKHPKVWDRLYLRTFP
jgi:hypothetical protein